MKVYGKQLRKLILKEASISYTHDMLKYIEDHNIEAWVDNIGDKMFIVAKSYYYDSNTGKTHSDVKRFDVGAGPKVLYRNIRNWLGY